MLRILLITAGLCCSMTALAQFHTVTPHTARYRIERVEQGTAGKTKEVTEKAVEDLSSDTASMRKQWIDSYLSVSYPLKEIHVTSPFGVRTDPFTKKRRKHNGLDLRADRCETYAMMHGIVVKTGQDRVSGKYVTVRHGNFSVSYCHLSEWRVKKGDCVRPGDVVGISGSTGRSTGPHLHLSVRMGRRHINPVVLLQFIDETRRQALEKLSNYDL
ncbi:M23 family metallopeptidase [Bacteroides acidifaciens]|uniref:M23 family metallopeptidase n=1 Tax=Bacteroides acidifaciens TaxID=85831 RepID=UPI000ADD9CA7|nr:M23 family metallopeptidase [Bacteroides acidifaciens]